MGLIGWFLAAFFFLMARCADRAFWDLSKETEKLISLANELLDRQESSK